jgi:hypothetical protein
VEQLKVDLTGRYTILSLLKEPGLDLYPEARERLALEDVAEQIQADDLHVVPVASADGGVGYRLSFGQRARPHGGTPRAAPIGTAGTRF